MRKPNSYPVLLAILAGLVLGLGLGIIASRPGTLQAQDARAVQSEVAAPAIASAAEKVQRFGAMIGLRPEKKAEYVRLHAHCWPEILAMLKKCHIRNYSIYLGEVDGKLYLFSYFEYTGEDIAKDMAVMKADPKTREWWSYTDPCQIRLPGTKEGDWWKSIPEVFHMK